MPRPKRAAPNASSDSWPDARCADPTAEVMRRLAVNLRTAIGGRSIRLVERETGVDHTLIGKLLAGSAWVEAATVARLEKGLGVSLWPGR